MLANKSNRAPLKTRVIYALFCAFLTALIFELVMTSAFTWVNFFLLAVILFPTNLGMSYFFLKIKK